MEPKFDELVFYIDTGTERKNQKKDGSYEESSHFNKTK
jgi:hypothetical protein